jgi:hypothetical protein
MKGNTMSTTIYTATEQFADFSKANVAQAQRIAALAIENAEKFLRLNLNAAKVVLANGAEGAAAVASVKDVQDLMALRAKYAETGVQTATALHEGPLRALVGSASAIHGARRRSVVDVHEGCRRVGREGQQVGPGRLGAAVNAFKSTFAASTAAFDQFQKATKQVVSLADASVRAASANAVNAAKAATKGRKAA